MNRRSFLHASLAAGGLILVPKFGRIFRPPEPTRVVIIRNGYVATGIPAIDFSSFTIEVSGGHGWHRWVYTGPPDTIVIPSLKPGASFLEQFSHITVRT